MLRLTRIITLLILMLVSGLAAADIINLNTADASSLAKTMDGIGLTKAQAIVAYRDQHGGFSSLEQLLQVKGIGKKTLDRNREKISLETGSTPN
ncbi:MAG: helix-hairpin-helix domain-containing protein [Gammaproteobacteria bacterium]|nr:helix-hairpin-helix domain-containing protein [Gammaproteobacteria bacterium]